MTAGASNERRRPRVRAIELAAGYGGAPVISNLSIDVGDGEVVLIVGPNGAGKSTLVKAIQGELTLMGGRVEFDGSDVSELTADERARLGLGYVPQVRDVFPGMTVMENLEMGGYRLDQPQVRHRIEELFTHFPQLRALRRRLARELSGGERKLVGVARALVANPTFLILDEPTANLSPRIATDVLEEVIGTLQSSGRPVLLIEQRVALALPVATWVYVMVDGTCRYSASSDEIASAEDLSSYFLMAKPVGSERDAT